MPSLPSKVNLCSTYRKSWKFIVALNSSLPHIYHLCFKYTGIQFLLREVHWKIKTITFSIFFYSNILLFFSLSLFSKLPSGKTECKNKKKCWVEHLSVCDTVCFPSSLPVRLHALMSSPACSGFHLVHKSLALPAQVNYLTTSSSATNDYPVGLITWKDDSKTATDEPRPPMGKAHT